MAPPGIELTAILTALNEEQNVDEALSECLRAFDEFGISGEIVAINDGSDDGTGRIMSEWSKRDARVRVVTHEKPRGVGTSFWAGVDVARGAAVVWVPGDNENDPRETFRYLALLNHVDILIPFVFNKNVRSLYRNALSFIYRFIINSTFLVYFNYTNGTNIYRTAILRELDNRSTGFFYQTDMLIRLVKRGYLFAEVPYRLGVRKNGVSRATTFPSFLKVVRGYLRLVKDIYWGNSGRFLETHAAGSVTQARRNPGTPPVLRP